VDDRGVFGLEQASREELLALVVAQAGLVEQLQQQVAVQVAVQAARIAELERRLSRNSGNSSMPPSSDDVLPGRACPAGGRVAGGGRKRGK
jgi:transposase